MHVYPSRRDLLKGCAALLVAPALRGAPASNPLNLVVAPSAMTLFTESGSHDLTRNGKTWQAPNIEVSTQITDNLLRLNLHSPQDNPLRLHVRWALTPGDKLRFLGDAWERSYGDLAFRHMEPDDVLPWYVVATDGQATYAFGVKTAPTALCFWKIDPQGISLWCDIRNGGRAVQLKSRQLHIADVVSQAYTDRTPFQAAQAFCKLMCETPRLPKAPVYGGNNWYYAYGKSSASDILHDAGRIALLSSSLTNRPFMVIDDGWSVNPTAGPWRSGNKNFPDMESLAKAMLKADVLPGLWTRPLFTREKVTPAMLLRPLTLDPTNPEAAALIEQDMRTFVKWNYQMIKHDFSTYDLLGRWGFMMNSEITDSDWNFQDRSRTNAEIIRDFYSLLRKAAGETMLLGCNTVGHLAAGLFELQRTGDDTSGRDWTRTRKMGVNTLAFRMPQHNNFFAIDADCVGLTPQISWIENRQWLELLATSGTAVFASIDPKALGKDQSAALQAAFRIASKSQPSAEPLDWLTNNEPEHWSAGGTKASYDWFT